MQGTRQRRLLASLAAPPLPGELLSPGRRRCRRCRLLQRAMLLLRISWATCNLVLSLRPGVLSGGTVPRQHLQFIPSSTRRIMGRPPAAAPHASSLDASTGASAAQVAAYYTVPMPSASLRAAPPRPPGGSAGCGLVATSSTRRTRMTWHRQSACLRDCDPAFWNVTHPKGSSLQLAGLVGCMRQPRRRRGLSRRRELLICKIAGRCWQALGWPRPQTWP